MNIWSVHCRLPNCVIGGVEGLKAKVKVEINLEEREKKNEVLKVKVEINLEEHVWKWKEANVLARGPSCLKRGELRPEWCIVSCPTTAI